MGLKKGMPNRVNRLDYEKEIIYPAIAKFLLDADISMWEFADWCGVSKEAIRPTLLGLRDPKKSTIDKILEQLDMTYEEAFKTNHGDK